MSASQISTISQNTLISVYSTQKRKRVCESARRTLTLSFKMAVVDFHEIFKQLAFARYAQDPFSEFGDWTDHSLWIKLLQVVDERRSCCHDMNSVIRVVSSYASQYVADPNVNWLKDEALKNYVISVFGSNSLIDKRGQLSVDLLKTIQKNQAINEQVAESCGERSYVKRQRRRSKELGSSSGMERMLRCHEKLEENNSLQLTPESKEFSNQLLYFFNNNYLPVGKLKDAFEYFYEGCAQKKMLKIQTWLALNKEGQVEFLSKIPQMQVPNSR